MKFKITYEILGEQDFFYIEGDEIRGVLEYKDMLLEEMCATEIKTEEV